MATIKKSMAFRPKAKAGIKLKKAQNGTEEGKGPSDDYKERQFGKAPAKSQEGEGPSSDEKVRQGDRAPGAKTPPNKFTPVTPPASAPEKKQSFGEAFKAARAAKKGTFEWNGKKYTSDTKEEAAKKSTPASKPAASAPAKSEPAKASGPSKADADKASSTASKLTGTPNIPSRPAYKRPGKDVEGDGKGALKSKETPAFSSKPNIPSRPDYETPGLKGPYRSGMLKKGGMIKKKMKAGGVVAKSPAAKKFAALAPPKNKITFADKIAGAKKVVKAVKKAKKK